MNLTDYYCNLCFHLDQDFFFVFLDPGSRNQWIFLVLSKNKTKQTIKQTKAKFHRIHPTKSNFKKLIINSDHVFR